MHETNEATLRALQGKRFVASYSGGKDCLLAVHRAVQCGMVLQGLIITYNTDRARSWFHGVPRSVLTQVEQAVGAPVVLIETSGSAYAENFEAALRAQRQLGAQACVFGDIDLDGHLAWCTERCDAVGLQAVFPLWKESRAALVREGLDAGFAPRVTVVDTTRLSARFLGEMLTPALMQDIAAEGADVCGENGEYHTFVTNCPLFSAPVKPHFGAPLQDGNYLILPMLPESNCAQQIL